MNAKLKTNPYSKEIGEKFQKLVDVMYTLRSEDGCPWDRAQTLKDLKQYLLEETYELLETLDQQDDRAMLEELGDLLLQVVFLAQVMQERSSFTLLEVLEQLAEKLIGRHPHVFDDVKVESPEQAVVNWESMKNRGTAGKPAKNSVLQGVPKNLPALLQANLISTKAARVGFDWETENDVWKKFEEELNEFREASTAERKEEEMGDLLFTIVNLARKNKINPEDALRAANAKFRKRFQDLEERVRASHRELKDLSLEELDSIWEQVKKR